MTNTSPTAARAARRLVCLILLVGAGCGLVRPNAVTRLVLLAPFEGRYQALGYDAYYAVQLALSQANAAESGIELLAVDDGSTLESALERAQAIARDPLVGAVLALGPWASSTSVQQAIDPIPMLVIGAWGSRPAAPSSFFLTNPQLDGLLPSGEADSIPVDAQLGDFAAYEPFSTLLLSRSDITALSSGSLPDSNYRQQFLGLGLYVPEPGLLATLTTDAARIALAVLRQPDPLNALANDSYTGLNGAIHFEDGYWAEAPIHAYQFDTEGQLLAVERVIE
ncbi:MAG: hypothetical protein JNM70_06065 [Anaerolineae bacterium]|nr:hypothetical protein [Anaerolineae bacterium]